MAIRTDITVDWQASPRIATVAAPSTELTIQDLHDTLRYLEDTEGASFPYIIDSAGKESLGGGVYVGITTTLQNCKVAFEDRAGPTFAQCNISGGNLVAVDDVGDNIDPIQTTDYTQIIRVSSSSATLQELSSIQFSSFAGGVTVDTSSPYSGTTFPTGTQEQPVNNLADAKTIAEERGLNTFYIIGDLTIGSSGDYTSYTFIGQSHINSTLTIESSATVLNCEFYEATVIGTLDGNCQIKNCKIGNLDYIEGHVELCVLEGTITLQGNAHFMDCWSGVAGSSTPVIDMGGSGAELGLRNYNGGIKLINKSGSEAVSIDLNAGQVILDSTVTNGNIVVRGVGMVTDNSTATVNAGGLINPSNVADAVWDEPTSGHTTSGSFGEKVGKKLLTLAKFLGFK